MRRLATVTAAVTLAVAGAGPATAGLPGFHTPTGNIGCMYFEGTLRCDVLSGLRPYPSRACELDWTGLSLRARGRARLVCAGDTAVDRRTPTLRYGRSWRRAGITCVSRRTGLRCVNRSGHGFFLSRERWRSF